MNKTTKNEIFKNATVAKKCKSSLYNFKGREIEGIEVDRIDHRDHPDYADAHISRAFYTDGTELEDFEIDELNEDSDFVYEMVMKKIF